MPNFESALPTLGERARALPKLDPDLMKAFEEAIRLTDKAYELAQSKGKAQS